MRSAFVDGASTGRPGVFLSVTCVACGGRLGPTKRFGAVTLAGCARCGSATAVPRRSPEELVELHNQPAYYEKVYFEARRGERADTRARVERICRLIGRHAPALPLAGGRILDVGCDTGEFVLALSSAVQAQPFGVEVARRAAAVAESRGVQMMISDLEAAPPEFSSFALATAIDVVEHVADPAQFLEVIASRLAPRGVLYLETPNWHASAYRIGSRAAAFSRSRPRRVFSRLFPPEHVQYFTADGLRALVARTDLRPLEISARKLAPRAVAGGVPIQAATWAAQLPDRAESRILLCALLSASGNAR